MPSFEKLVVNVVDSSGRALENPRPLRVVTEGEHKGKYGVTKKGKVLLAECVSGDTARIDLKGERIPHEMTRVATDADLSPEHLPAEVDGPSDLERAEELNSDDSEWIEISNGDYVEYAVICDGKPYFVSVEGDNGGQREVFVANGPIHVEGDDAEIRAAVYAEIREIVDDQVEFNLDLLVGKIVESQDAFALTDRIVAALERSQSYDDAADFVDRLAREGMQMEGASI